MRHLSAAILLALGGKTVGKQISNLTDKINR